MKAKIMAKAPRKRGSPHIQVEGIPPTSRVCAQWSMRTHGPSFADLAMAREVAALSATAQRLLRTSISIRDSLYWNSPRESANKGSKRNRSLSLVAESDDRDNNAPVPLVDSQQESHQEPQAVYDRLSRAIEQLTGEEQKVFASIRDKKSDYRKVATALKKRDTSGLLRKEHIRILRNIVRTLDDIEI